MTSMSVGLLRTKVRRYYYGAWNSVPWLAVTLTLICLLALPMIMEVVVSPAHVLRPRTGLRKKLVMTKAKSGLIDKPAGQTAMFNARVPQPRVNEPPQVVGPVRSVNPRIQINQPAANQLHYIMKKPVVAQHAVIPNVVPPVLPWNMQSKSGKSNPVSNLKVPPRQEQLYPRRIGKGDSLNPQNFWKSVNEMSTIVGAPATFEQSPEKNTSTFDKLTKKPSDLKQSKSDEPQLENKVPLIRNVSLQRPSPKAAPVERPPPKAAPVERPPPKAVPVERPPAQNPIAQQPAPRNIVNTSTEQTSVGKIEKSVEDPELAEWLQLQKERLERIQRVCKDSTVRATSNVTAASPITRHMLVESRHKVLYCRIPKVASTSWSIALAALQTQRTADQLRRDKAKHHYLLHNDAHLAVYDVKPLTQFSPTEQKTIVKDYPKFFFVRHPFERLVSAYKDKFMNPYPTEQLFININKYILKRIRRGVTRRDLRHPTNATFVEYVQYVLRDRRNTHWALTTDLCQACRVNYDYVGKLETFSRDVGHILKLAMGVVSKGYFIVSNPTTVQNARRYRYSYPSYFKGVPKGLISQLYTTYKYDFEMYDFKLDL